MNVVKGEDGREYLEFQGTVSTNPLWMASTNQDGATWVAVTQPYASDSTAPYTIDDLFAMRNKTWARWPEALLPGDAPSITVNRWLPGDPDPSVPEQPSGRFQNLDWAS